MYIMYIYLSFYPLVSNDNARMHYKVITVRVTTRVNKYQLSLTNPRDALVTANVLQTNEVDAQFDRLAIKLS